MTSKEGFVSRTVRGGDPLSVIRQEYFFGRVGDQGLTRCQRRVYRVIVRFRDCQRLIHAVDKGDP